MANVLLTGATGFIGRPLAKRLIADGHKLVAAVRRHSDLLPDSITQIGVGEIGPETCWDEALRDIDVVIHLAARVHVMQETATDPDAEFQRINTQGTLHLASQAANVGVRRFVFLSSIKVNGEFTLPGKPFRASDSHVPDDPYGRSKYLAEQGLLELAKKTPLEYVIIRPPLVYGPGVKANFARMMAWVDRGIPLPLGAIHNQRSVVALDNLIDLIVTTTIHPRAGNHTLLVSDGQDFSTSQLLTEIAHAMNRKPRLIPVPEPLLSLVFRMIGKTNIAQRLLGSLAVDIGPTRDKLDWSPPVTTQQALIGTVEAFAQSETGSLSGKL